jgi:hypothetical protein
VSGVNDRRLELLLADPATAPHTELDPQPPRRING